MAGQLTLAKKRQVADRMLAYFKDREIATCPSTYKMLVEVSDAINEPIYNLWKAHAILRMMGRLELNARNGKKGFRVLSYTPLTVGLPDRPEWPICEVKYCPILRLLRRKFPEINIEGE